MQADTRLIGHSQKQAQTQIVCLYFTSLLTVISDSWDLPSGEAAALDIEELATHWSQPCPYCACETGTHQ